MFFHFQQKFDRNSKYDTFSIYSGPLRLLSAGTLAGLTIAGLLLGVLRLFSEATASTAQFLLPDVRVLRFILFIIAAGTLDTLLLALHKIILLRIPEKDPLSKLGAGTLKSLFPLSLWVASWLLFDSSKIFPDTAPTAVIAAEIIAGGLLTLLIYTLWFRCYRLILSGITTVDWKMIIDKHRFTEMLSLLFAEGRRYNIPLSFLLLEIQTGAETQVSDKTVMKIREQLLEELPGLLRSIDIAARLDDSSHIGILLHTDAGSLVYPLERIRELFNRLRLQFNLPESMQLNYAVSQYHESMNHEREMYEQVLNQIKKNPQKFS